MKYIKQLIALIIWLVCYIPTSILVLIVLINVVLKRRSQVRAADIAS